MKILILNSSPHQEKGNTQAYLKAANEYFKQQKQIQFEGYYHEANQEMNDDFETTTADEIE